MIRTQDILVACAAIALCACGGGSSISTGLPRDKQLNTLTPADLKSACLNAQKSARQASESTLRGVCAAQALYKSETEAECTAGLDACVTAAQASLAHATDPAICDQPSTVSTTPFASCTATVGDLEDCENAAGDSVAQNYGSITCASAKPVISNPYMSSGCSSINAKCPSIFGGDTTTPPVTDMGNGKQ